MRETEFTMTEQQFEVLEHFCAAELKRTSLVQIGDVDSDLVSTKELILNLRKHLGVTQVINNMLFRQSRGEGDFLNKLKFYGAVKKVIIRSGGSDKMLNLRVFIWLLHEVRMKLEVAKSGHLAEKAMRVINAGVSGGP